MYGINYQLIVYMLLVKNVFKNRIDKYSGTSLIRSSAGLVKRDLNREVALLQGANLHCRMQFGTEPG